MKRKILSALLGIVSFSFALGQSDPQFGLAPYQAFTGSDFDHINLYTGLLNFDIPIFSYPQRGGKIKLSNSFRYNSKYYSTVSFCDPGDPSDCDVFLAHARQEAPQLGTGNMAYYHLGVFNEPLPSGFVLVNDSLVRIYSAGYTLSTGGYGIDDTPTMRKSFCEYQMVTSDGSTHPVNSLYGTFNNQCGDPSQVASDVMMSLDGTGYRIDSLGIHDKNGTLVGRLDVDGNQLASTYDSDGNVTGTVDTMGRNFGLGDLTTTSTTDYSNCSGPLSVTSASIMTGPGPNGSTQTYKFCYASAPVYIPAAYCNLDDDLTTNETVLQSIVLPNLQTWTFEYQARAVGDPSNIAYGDVSKITLPTGGTISYSYAMEGGTSCSAGVTQRTVFDGVNSRTWTYQDAVNTGGAYALETDPDGNVTRTDFAGDGYPTSVKNYSGSSTLLKEVDTTYMSVPAISESEINGNLSSVDRLPISVTTTLSNGLVSQKTFAYCCDYTFGSFFYSFDGRGYSGGVPAPLTADLGIQTDEKDYDYGTGAPGALLKETSTAYLWQTNTSYLTANILNTPTSFTTKDGNGNTVASTSYTYDESNYLAASGVSASPTHTTPPYGNIFGHVTTTSSFLPGWNASVQTHTAWYDTGEPYQKIDAKGTTVATLNYTSAYLWSLPVSVTTPIGTTSYGYDPISGAETSKIDLNNNPTSWTYDDIGRLTGVTRADQGWTRYCYKDNAAECDSPAPLYSFRITSSLAGPTSPENEPSYTKSEQDFDALGRPTTTKVFESASSTIYTDKTYDDLGNVHSVSNPYRSLVDSTYGITSYTYDALGEKLTETEPDGNVIHWCYNGVASVSGQAGCAANTSTQQGGSWVDEVQENGSHWQHVSDGLGRLIAVMEPDASSGSPSTETDYFYDPLNNLTSVWQKGHPGTTPQGFTNPEVSKLRTFTYDSLSRLITSNNPETGTICYGQWSGGSVGSGSCQGGYDPNGNLLFKTDTNGMTISYTYDALNRLTSKTAPDGGSTAENFYYDQCFSGYPCGNPIGRLVLEGNNSQGGQIFAYDAMGRVTNTDWFNWNTQSWQSGMGVLYDLQGNPTQLTYPDGRVVMQVLDGAGRLASVTDVSPNSSGVPYISGLQYYPSGAVLTSTYGNGVTQGIALNNRLQPCHEMANTPLLPSPTSGGNLLERQLFYGATVETNCGAAGGNNGNIYNVLEGVGDTTSQSFAYDFLNRLTGAYSVNRPVASTYSQTYNYDSFGNMLTVDNLHTPMNYGIDSATNRTTLNGTLQTGDLQYYPNGALYQSPAALGGYLYYWYTAEGYLRGIGTNSASDTFNPGSYLYDALGERTLAYHNNQTWNEYVYLNGQPLADLDNTGTWTDYIYANGQKIAMAASQKPLWHMHGIRNGVTDVGCGTIWTVGSLASNINGVQIQDGDHWVYDLNQQDAYSGLGILFQDGTGTGSVLDENTGNALVDNPTPAGWAHMMADLSPFAGEVMSYAVGGAQPSPYIGSWDIWIANMAIVHADGTVLPLFSGQPIGGSLWGSCGEQGLSFETDLTPTSDRNVSTNYYLADQVGTTQMELSGGGWPMWQGAFTPFGQEIVNGSEQNLIGQQTADGTNNRYKFTGKERDAESGLDYFGARYYVSNMGRWMSPDWAEKPEAVPYSSLPNPQSLNLYGYVGNNPLNKIDPDGHTESTGDERNDVVQQEVNSANSEAAAAYGSFGTNGAASQTGAASSNKTSSARSDQQQGSQQISAPPAVAGTLTINVILSGDGSSTDGHAWISFMPDGGTNATYGTYGNNNGAQGVQGVNENTELGEHPDTFRSVHLNAEQAAALSQYIASQISEGGGAWSYTAPCSSFASEGWYAATGEYLSPSRGGVLSTPTNLQNAIRQANGGQNMGVMNHPVAPAPILQGDIP